MVDGLRALLWGSADAAQLPPGFVIPPMPPSEGDLPPLRPHPSRYAYMGGTVIWTYADRNADPDCYGTFTDLDGNLLWCVDRQFFGFIMFMCSLPNISLGILDMIYDVPVAQQGEWRRGFQGYLSHVSFCTMMCLVYCERFCISEMAADATAFFLQPFRVAT